jgi:hypothetical protein
MCRYKYDEIFDGLGPLDGKVTGAGTNISDIICLSNFLCCPGTHIIQILVEMSLIS